MFWLVGVFFHRRSTTMISGKSPFLEGMSAEFQMRKLHTLLLSFQSEAAPNLTTDSRSREQNTWIQRLLTNEQMGSLFGLDPIKHWIGLQ